jgi:hypothetical protein
MDLLTLFDLLLIAASYRLGVHNTRYPGDVTDRMARGWKWLWKDRD